MRQVIGPLIFGCGIILSILTTPYAASSSDPEHAYIGTAKCKMCHNSPGKGKQFTKWTQSPHSKAYAILASARARTIAADRGIADPQKADACLRCHVTGHGAPKKMLTQKHKDEDGVGCESCHGPGGDYWKMTLMKNRAKSIAAGLKIPTEETCIRCHNAESPTYKPFDFKTFLAKIAHPNPKRAR